MHQWIFDSLMDAWVCSAGMERERNFTPSMQRRKLGERGGNNGVQTLQGTDGFYDNWPVSSSRPPRAQRKLPRQGTDREFTDFLL